MGKAEAERSFLLDGDPPVEVLVRRSARARRLSLRVSALDGRVTLTLPRRAEVGEALAFARSRAGWIREHLARQPEPVHVRPGVRLPLAGGMVTIATGPVRALRLRGDSLVIPEHRAGQAAAVVRGWLKGRARDALATACDRHATALGRGYGRLTLRDTRSRWGSCSAEGNLMFSWRLIMAPPEVLDYVAAHEVAHLVEMNHSPAFWALVEKLFPAHRAARRWLREHGTGLHRYRFDGGCED
ncbi:hypothetical protein SAMN05216257_104323 [Meinhardsimonia xiamenensis]|jgi:predicted metal-dependent hydrolase|uniref:YgjP-like metallopeptidase domain-containing protein n=1 Tax=Meinhardsimonia xiamenensis TaxID=990712 RepID=A0A1G9EHR6_9RHOB|nr:SprT family zinc-dependent metalloprotease [Meinhardsimonia xiamenensis]PRX33761.1 hypothetical protein LV81_02191 [Meinhardsimonia xiamenensis]SDK75690.1 hypothetical protein SAMN05216257_104323 [Meinhardsimonia xiamenensis]